MESSRGSLLLAGDVGGTSTRLALARPDGTLLAVARGGPGNPNAVGRDTAAAEIAAVFTRCLAAARARLDTSDRAAGPAAGPAAEPREPGDAAAAWVTGVLGMAGASALTEPAEFLARALPGVPTAAVRVLPDLAVAFSAGSADRAGYVLLAGTGAGAVEVADGEVVERRDGWGWLLGDRGSAFWLGREAVRATLDGLQRRRPAGPLAAAVLAATGAPDLAGLLAAVYRRPPVELAALAPVVSATAATDSVAAGIAGRAADHLLTTWRGLAPRPGATVVLTGSVLTAPGPVRDAVLAALRPADGGPNRLGEARDGLAGALWLAVRGSGAARAGPDTSEHARLVAQDFTDACG